MSLFFLTLSATSYYTSLHFSSLHFLCFWILKRKSRNFFFSKLYKKTFPFSSFFFFFIFNFNPHFFSFFSSFFFQFF